MDSMTIDGEVMFSSPNKRDSLAEISLGTNSPRNPSLSKVLFESEFEYSRRFSEFQFPKADSMKLAKDPTTSSSNPNSKPSTPRTPRGSLPLSPRMTPKEVPKISLLPLHKTFSSLKSFTQEDPSSSSSKSFSGAILTSASFGSPSSVANEANKKPDEKVDLYPTPTKSFARILKRENLDEISILQEEDSENYSNAEFNQITKIVVQPEKKPFVALKNSRLVLHSHGIFHDKRKNEIISLVSLKQFRFFKSSRRLSVIVKKGFDKSFHEVSLCRWGQHPSDRVHACSCFDTKHSLLFIFGGIYVEDASNSNEKNPLFMNDLWCFSLRAKKWVQILQCNDPQNSIPPIQHAKMIFREKNDSISLYIFGGVCPREGGVSEQYFQGMLIIELGNIGSQPTVLSIQTLQTDSDLYPRIGHSLVYHQPSDSMIVFGGQRQSGQIINDFWTYNCSQRTWKEFTRLMDNSQKLRFFGLSFHSECFVNNESQILFLGGRNLLNDENYAIIFDLRSEKHHIPKFLASIATSTDFASSESSNNTKSDLGSLFPRHFHTMCGGFTTNSILIFGGKQFSTKKELPALVWLFLGQEQPLQMHHSNFLENPSIHGQKPPNEPKKDMQTNQFFLEFTKLHFMDCFMPVLTQYEIEIKKKQPLKEPDSFIEFEINFSLPSIALNENISNSPNIPASKPPTVSRVSSSPNINMTGSPGSFQAKKEFFANPQSQQILPSQLKINFFSNMLLHIATISHEYSKNDANIDNFWENFIDLMPESQQDLKKVLWWKNGKFFCTFNEKNHLMQAMKKLIPASAEGFELGTHYAPKMNSELPPLIRKLFVFLSEFKEIGSFSSTLFKISSKKVGQKMTFLKPALFLCLINICLLLNLEFVGDWLLSKLVLSAEKTALEDKFEFVIELLVLVRAVVNEIRNEEQQKGISLLQNNKQEIPLNNDASKFANPKFMKFSENCIDLCSNFISKNFADCLRFEKLKNKIENVMDKKQILELFSNVFNPKESPFENERLMTFNSMIPTANLSTKQLVLQQQFLAINHFEDFGLCLSQKRNESRRKKDKKLSQALNDKDFFGVQLKNETIYVHNSVFIENPALSWAVLLCLSFLSKNSSILKKGNEKNVAIAFGLWFSWFYCFDAATIHIDEQEDQENDWKFAEIFRTVLQFLKEFENFTEILLQNPKDEAILNFFGSNHQELLKDDMRSQWNEILLDGRYINEKYLFLSSEIERIKKFCSILCAELASSTSDLSNHQERILSDFYYLMNGVQANFGLNSKKNSVIEKSETRKPKKLKKEEEDLKITVVEEENSDGNTQKKTENCDFPSLDKPRINLPRKKKSRNNVSELLDNAISDQTENSLFSLEQDSKTSKIEPILTTKISTIPALSPSEITRIMTPIPFKVPKLPIKTPTNQNQNPVATPSNSLEAGSTSGTKQDSPFKLISPFQIVSSKQAKKRASGDLINNSPSGGPHGM